MALLDNRLVLLLTIRRDVYFLFKKLFPFDWSRKPKPTNKNERNRHNKQNKNGCFFPFHFILFFETETNPISKTILSKL